MLACIDAPSDDPELIEALLEGVTVANHILLSRTRLPPLYRSGVVYRREKGTERWLLIPQVLRAGSGDCEDLAAWRASELRLVGVPARVALVKGRRARWHAVVLLPDGSIEDPSANLGM